MNITKPIIRKIKDNETALAEFEKEIKTNEAEDTKDIIMNFPTVYIHNWPETNKYDVYVGESNNIFARTRQHYQSRIKHETWQYRMMKTDASLYIIGHEHFNKSLTLDVENRLMHYLMSVDKVHQVHNGRGILRSIIIHRQNSKKYFKKYGQNYMSQMKNFFRMKIS